MTDKLTDLKFDQQNPRRHDERNLKVIGESLKATGPARSIVIDEDDNILAGNGVTEAAKAAGIERVIVVEAEDDALIAVRKRGLTPKQKTALKYYDNRSAELAEWEPERILADLDSGLDMGQFWNERELNALLAGLDTEQKEDAGPQIDKAAELQKKWGTCLGQVWQLGEHRLVVGDCTDKAVVEAVMRGERADCICTDPPYMTTDLKFDKKGVDWGWCSLWINYIQQNGYLSLFAPVELLAQTANLWAMRFSGVWVKSAGGIRMYNAKKPMCQSELYAVFAHPNHKISELVWNDVLHEGEPYKRVQRNTGYKRGGEDQLDRSNAGTWTKDGFISINNGTREQTDVLWGASKSRMAHDERTQHPTQKPIECISVLVQWLTNSGMIVCDPFLGSGTTLIACEQLKRKCRAVEIDPGYCAVAIQRWVDLTNQEPMLLNK